MLAAQYLQFPNYQCLVTRKNRRELIGPNSIWRNLNKWLTRPELGPLRLDPRDDINKSELVMTAPSGATIWFRHFDDEDSIEKIQSESYDREIHDEAAQLKKRILEFSYRSLRHGEPDTRIPLAMVLLGNPGGPATDYITKRYVDGPYSYYWMDWRHNPFHDTKVYSKTLDNLSYADRQYQKYGNWRYRLKAGDIFDAEMIDLATIDLDIYEYIRENFELKQLIRTWDIASTERKTSDYTASTLFEIYEENLKLAISQESTKKKPGPLQDYMKLVMARDGEEVEQRIEHQPAAAGDHLDYYFEADFNDYNCDFIEVRKNKVLRAGKLVPWIKNGAYFNKHMDLSWDKHGTLLFMEDPQHPYLSIFKGQAVNFPNFKRLTEEDEESEHDDRIDSVSLILQKPKSYMGAMVVDLNS